MNAHDNPFVRFDDIMAERGFTDRIEAHTFVEHFRWFSRSEHNCPRPINKWLSQHKSHRLGAFAGGLIFNMTTVYNWCDEHNESSFRFLEWLDRAAAAIDECEELCEAAYIQEQLDKAYNREGL